MKAADKGMMGKKTLVKAVDKGVMMDDGLVVCGPTRNRNILGHCFQGVDGGGSEA